jgi:hypothetical protein
MAVLAGFANFKPSGLLKFATAKKERMREWHWCHYKRFLVCCTLYNVQQALSKFGAKWLFLGFVSDWQGSRIGDFTKTRKKHRARIAGGASPPRFALLCLASYNWISVLQDNFATESAEPLPSSQADEENLPHGKDSPENDWARLVEFRISDTDCPS